MPRTGTTTKQFTRFSFPGTVADGACFVKALVRQEDVIVLVAQLQNYLGPSVTNSWEDIAPRVIERLRNEVDLDHLGGANPWWKFWDRSAVTNAVIMAKTRWVEYYPPSTGLLANGSIAEVSLSPRLDWTHTTKEVLARKFDIQTSFFNV